MGHPGAAATGDEVIGPGDGSAELGDGRPLADEVVEDRHAYPRGNSVLQVRPQDRSARRRSDPPRGIPSGHVPMSPGAGRYG
ncbi:hypothetical protein GCM10007147_27800 [Nocardiopsis kunsanensis]|uniref:Uncharacterized protein n=1 Tax=Nocardiopsis kunsanensis TaxID=141693 RepID=A0A918XFE1_9ACTN|nr:hypothetical protein GCM10007147_27800 [Nocardiopsis kunsanensis]